MAKKKINKSYILLYRSIMDEDMWKDKPFTKGQAWIDLLMLVFWEDSDSPVYEEKENTKAGSRWFGQEELAERWGWSRGKVRRQLIVLQTEQRIVQQTTHHGTLISIVNWDTYQHPAKLNGTTNGTTDDTSNGTSNGTQINEYNAFKKKNTHPSDEKPKAKYKDWNEDWKYTDSRGNVYDWGYMVRNFGDNAENMARIIVDEDRKSRS